MNEKKQYFEGWDWFLGRESKKRMTEQDVKNLLKEFEKNWKVYADYMDDATLKHTFDEMGLTRVNNEWVRSFFKHFIELRDTPEGRKRIIQWLYEMLYGKKPSGLQRISKKKASKINDTTSTKAVLYKARNMTIFDNNKILFDLHVTYTVHGLWNSIFENTKQGLDKIRKEKLNGTPFQRAVLKKFKEQYKDVMNYKFDSDYTPKKKLTLHQRFIAYKMSENNGWLDMSTTGAGKTDASLASVARTGSQNVVVFCPNNIVDQWSSSFIKDSFPNSQVLERKELLENDFADNIRSFYVANYEIMSYTMVKEISKRIKQQPIDMVIIDEVQNIKIRSDETISTRRKEIENLVKDLRKANPKLKVLMMSATVVINNIREAKSIIEMLAGKRFPEISTIGSFRSASRLHVRFLEYSTRYKYSINFKVKEQVHTVEKTLGIQQEKIDRLTWLDFERISIEAKIPKIIDCIKKQGGKTIIYTEFVSGITDVVAEGLEKAGIKVTFFTGSDKSGVTAEKEFFNGTNVMISSTPVAEGFDKLQKICNHLIFIGYPWTDAKVQQIVGRIKRRGQKNTVKIDHIHSVINGYEYDKNVKIDRINYKRSYADCVIDGTFNTTLALPKGKLRKEMIGEMKKYQPEERKELVLATPSKSEARALLKIDRLEKEISSKLKSEAKA